MQPAMPTDIRRILVVDDEEDVVAFVRALLSKRRTHWIEATTDPRDALARFRRAPFDLVISDIAMPGMRVTALAKEMSRLTPTTKIILMSGEELEQEAFKAGACAFLRKPASASDILGAPAKALSVDCAAGEPAGR